MASLPTKVLPPCPPSRKNPPNILQTQSIAEKSAVPNIPEPTIVTSQPRLKVVDVEKYQLGQYGTFSPHLQAREEKEASRSILLAFLASLLVVTVLTAVGFVGVSIFGFEDLNFEGSKVAMRGIEYRLRG